MKWSDTAVIATCLLAVTFSFSQTPTTPAFEVASIRLTPPGFTDSSSISSAGTPHFRATHVSLKILIGMAYGIQQKHIVGGPAWFESQLYDIEANSVGEQPLTAHDRQLALRKLFKERFHLVAHIETKEMPGYALIVVSKKPLLEPSEGPGQGYILSDRLSFPNASLSDLAVMLEHVTGRPCVDKTGLTGKYKIDLQFAPIDAEGSSLPSIFSALQDRLGVKLVPQKVSVDELHIDSVDRTPTDN